MIDEVHMLRERERGAYIQSGDDVQVSDHSILLAGARLEVLVARLKFFKSEMRFIAVSATIPNADDVAEWIGQGSRYADSERTCKPFVFGDEFRPCALHKVSWVSQRHFMRICGCEVSHLLILRGAVRQWL